MAERTQFGGLMAREEDRFANLAGASVTESAANTLTFQEIQFGIGLGAGVALLIDQIDYFINNLGTLFVADQDQVYMALCARNDLTDLSTEFNNRSVLHLATQMFDFTTSGQSYVQQPWQHQFAPPLIVATNRGSLYLAAQGVSLPSAATVYVRIYFRYIKLKSEEYLELAEAFNLMG